MKEKQHVFLASTGRCLYCDTYDRDPDGGLPCQEAPDSAPDYQDEEPIGPIVPRVC